MKNRQRLGTDELTNRQTENRNREELIDKQRLGTEKPNLKQTSL